LGNENNEQSIALNDNNYHLDWMILQGN